MTSLARAHRHRVLAAQSAAQSTHGGVVTSSEYELMCMQLQADRQRLKLIQSIQKKIETKRQMIGHYREWINATLAKGQGAQDVIVVTMLVWHIDIGEYDRALDIASYVMQHNLQFPDNYKRNVATLLLDEIPEGYIKSGDFNAASVATLNRVNQLTHEQDAPDQARAKLHKAFGYAIGAQLGDEDLKQEQIETAQEAKKQLERALDLFNGIGVKKDLEKLDRRIAKVQKAVENAATAPSS
jgi:hypothetical protein